MRILAVNCHTAYIYMLAKTGHEFFVLQAPNSPYAWDVRNRPLPQNVRLLNDTQLLSQVLGADTTHMFDYILMQDTFMGQDIKDLDILDRVLTKHIKAKRVMLFHNSYQVHFRNQPSEVRYFIQERLKHLLEGCQIVHISEFKKESWGIGGKVILPGIEENEFGGWNGKTNAGLLCLNNYQARDFMNGFVKTTMVMADHKMTLLGQQGREGNVAPNFEAYKTALRDHRFYICLNNPAFEDGYNLSMLEFMMTGGLAITLDHPTSPVIAGVNGFRSNNLSELNKFIHELDYSEAVEMGRAARESVCNMFSIDDFIKNWNEVFE